jgi:hypothetical protein
MSCHSVAVVLTLVHTKQIRINIHKRNNTKNTVQTKQNTANSSTHITKSKHITNNIIVVGQFYQRVYLFTAVKKSTNLMILALKTISYSQKIKH